MDNQYKMDARDYKEIVPEHRQIYFFLYEANKCIKWVTFSMVGDLINRFPCENIYQFTAILLRVWLP